MCRVGAEEGCTFFWSSDGVPAGHGRHWLQTESHTSLGGDVTAHTFDVETDKPSLESLLSWMLPACGLRQQFSTSKVLGLKMYRH